MTDHVSGIRACVLWVVGITICPVVLCAKFINQHNWNVTYCRQIIDEHLQHGDAVITGMQSSRRRVHDHISESKSYYVILHVPNNIFGEQSNRRVAGYNESFSTNSNRSHK
jgi:hypothetical protein